MQSTSKIDHGREADKTIAEMVKKSKSGQGTLTYAPTKASVQVSMPRRVAAAGKSGK